MLANGVKKVDGCAYHAIDGMKAEGKEVLMTLQIAQLQIPFFVECAPLPVAEQVGPVHTCWARATVSEHTPAHDSVGSIALRRDRTEICFESPRNQNRQRQKLSHTTSCGAYPCKQGMRIL